MSSISVKARQDLERQVAVALISAGLAAGYTIAVDDGEEEFPQMTDQDAILEKMFSVDEERLQFYKDGEWYGSVFLVYGNDGWDAVCDYSTKLEHIMGGVNELVEKYG